MRLGDLAAHLAHDVHHVREALDLHALHELDRADLGDAPDVVAPEVDEHDVLGALLRVGEELLLEREVLLGRLAAAPRSRERAHRHRPVLEAHHRLGARPGDARAVRLAGRGRQIEEVHVRRRIEQPHRAIDVEGVAAGARHRERAGEDDLEGVARGDVLLRPANARLVLLVVEIDRDVVREVRAVGRREVREARRARQIVERAIDRVLVGRRRWSPSGRARRRRRSSRRRGTARAAGSGDPTSPDRRAAPSR